MKETSMRSLWKDILKGDKKVPLVEKQVYRNVNKLAW